MPLLEEPAPEGANYCTVPVLHEFLFAPTIQIHDEDKVVKNSFEEGGKRNFKISDNKSKGHNKPNYVSQFYEN